jgi:hypothetical protein
VKNLIAALLLLGCGSANAANLTWTVDLLFSDGYTGSGTFDYDADTNTYSTIDIFVEYDDISGEGGYGFYSLITPRHDGNTAEADSNQVAFYPWYDFPEHYDFLWLTFSSPLTNSGGEIALDSSSGIFNQYIYDGGYVSPQMFITGGSVSAVPVPAAVWLFGSALGGLGWMRRRKTV